MVRNNLFFSQGKQSCLIHDLFPGALGHSKLLNFSVGLSVLDALTEEKKWIYTSRGSTTVNTDDKVPCTDFEEVSFSERKSALLCAPGTSFLDGRIQFLDQENKPVLVKLKGS